MIQNLENENVSFRSRNSEFKTAQAPKVLQQVLDIPFAPAPRVWAGPFSSLRLPCSGRFCSLAKIFVTVPEAESIGCFDQNVDTQMSAEGVPRVACWRFSAAPMQTVSRDTITFHIGSDFFTTCLDCDQNLGFDSHSRLLTEGGPDVVGCVHSTRLPTLWDCLCRGPKVFDGNNDDADDSDDTGDGKWTDYDSAKGSGMKGWTFEGTSPKRRRRLTLLRLASEGHRRFA
jgi:hypothetical protein